MGYSLRPGTLADALDFAACIDAAYAGYAAQGIDLPPVSEGIADDILDNTVLVAVEADTLVGGVIVSVDGDTAYLTNIAVHPDQAGRGIGSALMTAALSVARDAGHSTVELATHRDMPHNVALYQRLGWQVIGHQNDKVFMAFRLDPAGTRSRRRASASG